MKMILSVTSAALNRKVLGGCQVIFHWRQTHTRKKPKVCTAQLCDTYVVYKIQRKKEIYYSNVLGKPTPGRNPNLHCWTLYHYILYYLSHYFILKYIAMTVKNGQTKYTLKTIEAAVAFEGFAMENNLQSNIATEDNLG